MKIIKYVRIRVGSTDEDYCAQEIEHAWKRYMGGEEPHANDKQILGGVVMAVIKTLEAP